MSKLSTDEVVALVKRRQAQTQALFAPLPQPPSIPNLHTLATSVVKQLPAWTVGLGDLSTSFDIDEPHLVLVLAAYKPSREAVRHTVTYTAKLGHSRQPVSFTLKQSTDNHRPLENALQHTIDRVFAVSKPAAAAGVVKQLQLEPLANRDAAIAAYDATAAERREVAKELKQARAAVNHVKKKDDFTGTKAAIHHGMAARSAGKDDAMKMHLRNTHYIGHSAAVAIELEEAKKRAHELSQRVQQLSNAPASKKA